MSLKRVSILGCGWLGLPLAIRLVSSGYQVKGSTTLDSKADELASIGIEPYVITIKKNEVMAGKKQVQQFFNSDCLFLNIPFRRNLPDPREYYYQVEAAVDQVKRSGIKTVLFASSTSVYPQNCGLIKENDYFLPDNTRSIALTEIEKFLLSSLGFNVIILRFSGLYGPGRLIGKFLSVKIGPMDGARPVNLVHLDDCVEIVSRLIEEGSSNEIYNICSDKHPSREELYSKAAQALKIKPPFFTKQNPIDYKIVSNVKIKERLNYSFRFPDPLLSF